MLNTTPEGYPVLKDNENTERRLVYGGDFKEGLHWRKALSSCNKVLYVAGAGHKEDGLEVLHDYVTALGHAFQKSSLLGFNELDIDRATLIVMSQRLSRADKVRIIFKHPWNSIYRYVPGLIQSMEWNEIIERSLKGLFYKALVDPVVSRKVEERYEQYLSDKKAVERYARAHLPPEMRHGRKQRVLDVGCGRGRHVAILSQLGFAVTGMDLIAHPYWKRISNAAFIVGSAECLRYIPDSSFDVVACMQVLMYLNNDDSVLEEIKRILKGNGYLLLQVTNKENLHTVCTKGPLIPDPYLQRYYTQSELCSKLEKHGFRIGRVWTEKFYLPFIASIGNVVYEFVLSDSMRAIWDKLVPSRHLGLINVLAEPIRRVSEMRVG